VSHQTRSTFVLTHPNEFLQALVGLKDVRVIHYERRGPDVELMVEQVTGNVCCPSCGGRAQVKERPVVSYVDLPVYGTPMRLAWRKHRMRCPDASCPRRSWVLQDHRIAAKDCLLTTRAAKWATVQVGGGRTVSEVAAELACDWHTVNDAVTTYGEALLAADRKRLSRTTTIGLDETKFVALGRRGHADYATTVADVENHQVIDILPTRNFTEVARWLDKQPTGWKQRTRFGALDMSPTYAAVYSVVLPRADQVVDPFHVIALANRCLDSVRRRAQAERFGRRHKGNDPLYRARRVLVMGEETLDAEATARLWSLLALGDPAGEVAIAYRVKERLRDFYRTRDPTRPPGARRAQDSLPEERHAARGAEARPDHQGLVRQDLQLPPGPGVQRPHRGAQQPGEAHQADRLRVQELPELPDPGPALRGQAELAGPQIDRRPMTGAPRQNPNSRTSGGGSGPSGDRRVTGRTKPLVAASALCRA
jgi:transposase